MTLCTQLWTVRKIIGSNEGRITRSPDHIAVGVTWVRNFCFSLQISLNSSQVLQALLLLHQLPEASTKQFARKPIIRAKQTPSACVFLLQCMSEVYETDGASEGHIWLPLLTYLACAL